MAASAMAAASPAPKAVVIFMLRPYRYKFIRECHYIPLYALLLSQSPTVAIATCCYGTQLSTCSSPPRFHSPTSSGWTTCRARRSACRSRDWPPPKPRWDAAPVRKRKALCLAARPHACGDPAIRTVATGALCLDFRLGRNERDRCSDRSNRAATPARKWSMRRPGSAILSLLRARQERGRESSRPGQTRRSRQSCKSTIVQDHEPKADDSSHSPTSASHRDRVLSSHPGPAQAAYAPALCRPDSQLFPNPVLCIQPHSL